MYEIFLIFVFLLYVLIIIPAALGTSYGIRERYAKLLIKIFEWGATREGGSLDNGNVDFERREFDIRYSSEQHGIIMREKSARVQQKLHFFDTTSPSNTVETIVDDCLDFMTAGFEAVIEDQVTKRFKAEELASWNLLTRTGAPYKHITWKLTFLWICGFFFRYFILVPARLCVFFIGIAHLIVISYAIGFVNDKKRKKWLQELGMKTAMRIMCRASSVIVRYHDRENMTKNGICVANHTSPTDVLILSCDNCYAMVGQMQKGLLGFLQSILSRSTDHVWFNRSEADDRKGVLKRLQEHVDDPHKLPIIIFPEGTCINNTSVMMFKKGSFEIARVIYPIAMKYDSRLGDAFWNSSEQSYNDYVFRMMTSWAILCDVWYLPPMTRKDEESSIEFARRVRHAIAEKGGLLELEWDGMLKRMKVPPKLVVAQQKRYWERLSRKTTIAKSIQEAMDTSTTVLETVEDEHCFQDLLSGESQEDKKKL